MGYQQSRWCGRTGGTDGSSGDNPHNTTSVYGWASGGGGSVSITVNGTVGGNINANSAGGTVTVMINNETSVGGTINGNSGGGTTANSMLQFSLNKNEVCYGSSAEKTLSSQFPSNGTATINGQIFTWKVNRLV